MMLDSSSLSVLFYVCLDPLPSIKLVLCKIPAPASDLAMFALIIYNIVFCLIFFYYASTLAKIYDFGLSLRGSLVSSLSAEVRGMKVAFKVSS